MSHTRAKTNSYRLDLPFTKMNHDVNTFIQRVPCSLVFSSIRSPYKAIVVNNLSLCQTNRPASSDVGYVHICAPVSFIPVHGYAPLQYNTSYYSWFPVAFWIRVVEDNCFRIRSVTTFKLPALPCEQWKEYCSKIVLKILYYLHAVNNFCAVLNFTEIGT